MPLQKQVKTMAMAKGIDSKSDPKQVKGVLLELENGVFTTPGKLSKRNGYSVNEFQTEDNERPFESQSLIVHDDQLLVAGKIRDASLQVGIDQGHKLYRVDTQNSRTVVVDDFRAIATSIENVGQSTERTFFPDVDIIDNVIFYAYKQLGRLVGVSKSAVDDTVISEFELDTNIARIDDYKVLITPTENKFVCWAVRGSNNSLYSFEVPDSGLGTQVTTVRASNYSGVSPGFDASNIKTPTYGDYAMGVIYNSGVGGNFIVSIYEEDFTSIDTRTFSVAITTDKISINSLVESTNPLQTEWCAVCYSDITTTNEAFVGLFDPENLTNNQFTGDFVSLGTYSEVIQQIAVVDYPEYTPGTATNNSFLTFVEVEDSTDNFNNYIDVFRVDYTSGAVTQVDTLRHQSIAAKPFIDGTRVYVPTVTNSDVQSTYYIQRFTESATQTHLGAKALQSVADGPPAFPVSGLSKVVFDAVNEEWIQPALKRDRLSGDGEVLKSVKGIRYDFDTLSLQFERLGFSTHIAGGYLATYDGNFIFTAGLAYLPEIRSLTDSGGGTEVPEGTRFYKVGYEWTDHNGDLHRVLSIAKSVTVGVGGSNVTIVYPTLTIGHYPVLSEVTIHIYRRHATLGTYHKIDIGGTPPLLNDPTIDTFSVVDSTTESNLADNELDWSTGGVTLNLPFPSGDIITARRDRLFWVDSTNPTRVNCSKKKVAGLGLEYSDIMFVDVPTGGPITALGELDDKIIVYKEDQIRFFAGEGPNAFGVGTFSPDSLITTDVGCVDRNSIVKTQAGLFFKSKKGIYLLGRNLQTMYIGAPVEEYNEATVLSAMSHPTRTQTIFLSDESKMLVWDYFVNQWSVWTNHTDAVDAHIGRDSVVWIDDQGQLRIENSGFLDDDADAYPLKIGTEWVNLAGISGYQRIWWVVFEGQIKSTTVLTVNLYYDYDDTSPAETFTLDYSVNTGERMRLMPGRQLCQAIRVEVFDTSGESSEGYELSAIHLELGVSSATAKIKAAKTF